MGLRTTGDHGGRGRLRAAVAWLTIAASASAAGAQTTPVQGPPDGTYTLHVYTDLLQVPTVVLTRLHSNYRSLSKRNFTLSLSGGPAFHPATVRLEGDDAVSLGIVFDLTTDADPMFQSFAHAMATVRPGVFSPRDYVSVYAYDCELIRTTEDQPATREHLQESMTKVLTEGRESARNGANRSCWSEKRLYDAVARVAEDLGKLPGRRVMLVISDGADRHSVNDWMGVSRFMAGQSIAVFGLRPVGKPSTGGFGEGWLTVVSGDAFGSMCASTGGLVLDGDKSKRFLSGQIERLMTILRNRYIIEFPRPSNGSPGFYSIDVKTDDPTAIIRPAGVSFPPRERDPERPEGTVESDMSQMPLVGAKHEDAQPK